MSRFIAAALTPLFNTIAASSGPSYHRGWGEQIEWSPSYNDGLKAAAPQKKHVMVVVHLMSCPACVRKKHWFSRSKTIAQLSEKFVMVNVQPSEIPRSIANNLAPDGHYVPRILFLTPNGQVLKGIRTNHNQYGYVYMDESALVYNMRKLSMSSEPSSR